MHKMAATTHTKFNANTEALDVAKEFAAGIRGRTVIVTGVNRNGIGFSTSQAFVSSELCFKQIPVLTFTQASQSPAHLIITGRSPSKIQECVKALEAEFPDVDCRGLQVDLSVQQSVRDAAAKVMAWTDVPTIDIVVNSAGVMGIQERTLTSDGIEMHFATNHLGHWLLTCLIMPKLIKAAQNKSKGATRFVNVSSASPTVSSMRWSDMNFTKENKDIPRGEQPDYEWFKAWGYTYIEKQSYNPLDGYNRSKVANVLFGIGVTKRLFNKHGILSLAVDPGVIATELGRNFPPETLEAAKVMTEQGMFTRKTLGAGASTSMVAALDPKLAEGIGSDKMNWGSYLRDCQISKQACPFAVSSEEAEKLWELSEKLVGQNFAW
jgi:NAD(P)-dependent dehydrogenase (short-subunit alcohol dehydrogenase family)